MSYVSLENSLVLQLRTLGIYTDENCVSDDVDGAFRYADTQTSGFYRDNVCVVDYGGGRPGERLIWTHVANVLCAVRVENVTGATVQADAGAKLRLAIGSVRRLLFPNNTNVSPRCRLASINPPLVLERGTGIWWVCFMTVEMDERAMPCNMAQHDFWGDVGDKWEDAFEVWEEI